MGPVSTGPIFLRDDHALGTRGPVRRLHRRLDAAAQPIVPQESCTCVDGAILPLSLNRKTIEPTRSTRVSEAGANNSEGIWQQLRRRKVVQCGAAVARRTLSGLN
jgi:hypothetical protein